MVHDWIIENKIFLKKKEGVVSERGGVCLCVCVAAASIPKLKQRLLFFGHQ